MILLASGGWLMAQNKTITTVHGEKITYDARVNITERNNLPKTVGLMVFNTETKCHEFWDGNGWYNYCWGGYVDPAAITITTPPTAPAAVCAGTGTQTLTVVATGTGLTYQWKKDGTNLNNGGVIGGATSATLTLTNPTTANAGSYTVAVSNSTTTVTSNAVTTVVNALPTIATTTPGSRVGTGTVALGATPTSGTINWYAAATGGTALGTGTSFTTPSIAATTTYYAEANANSCISTPRTAVVATVTAPPAITAISCGVSGPAVDAGILEKDKAPTGITRKVSVTADGAGTFTITTNTVNNVKFEGTATFASAGTQDVLLTAVGTPNAAGVVNFTISGAGSCTFDRVITGPVGGGDVITATRRIWKDRNVGAQQVATSATDHLAYGSLFQYGRRADGHEVVSWANLTTANTLSGTVPGTVSVDNPYPSGGGQYIMGSVGDWRNPTSFDLWQKAPGLINNPCLSGYRVPTDVEWSAEIAAGGWTINTDGYNSALKLPLAGVRLNGNLAGAGGGGYYHGVSNVSSTSNCGGLELSTSVETRTSGWSGTFAMSVRCIKD